MSHPNQPLRRCVLAIGIFGLLAANYSPVAQAAMLGVNFIGGGGPGSGASVTSAAGVVPQDHWNNVAGATGSSASLTLDNGAGLSGAVLSWTTVGTYDSGATPQNANADLLKGFLDYNPTVTITGLPANGSYDVYIYLSDDQPGRGGSYTVNGVTQRLMESGPNPTGTLTLASADGSAQGSYGLFTNVTGATLTITTNSKDFRDPIAGVQVVGLTVPEPDSLGLLALGGLAVLRRRR